MCMEGTPWFVTIVFNMQPSTNCKSQQQHIGAVFHIIYRKVCLNKTIYCKVYLNGTVRTRNFLPLCSLPFCLVEYFSFIEICEHSFSLSISLLSFLNSFKNELKCRHGDNSRTGNSNSLFSFLVQLVCETTMLVRCSCNSRYLWRVGMYNILTSSFTLMCYPFLWIILQ